MAFLIFLFLCLIFPQQIIAAPSATITIVPATAISGSTIPIQFIIENSDPNISYYYKFFGGIGDSDTQIQTTTDLTYRSNWSNFPTITVDSEGKKVVDSYAYIVPNTISGPYNLFVRIAKVDNTSSTYTSSASIIAITGLSPTPTTTLTSTPIPTNTPTPDSTKINPDSGITLTEFMPYGLTSDKEWVEIYNKNDFPVKLIGWKIIDNSSNTKNLPDLIISSKGYVTYDFSSFLNNDGDKVILIDNNGKEINSYEYSDDSNRSLSFSWSLVNGSWCRADVTKGSANSNNCSILLTSTTTPTSSSTPTPTPTSTKYIPDELATASAVIEPKTESSFLSPTSTTNPTPTITNGLILGDSTSSSIATKKNYFPLILIISGGSLLTSPLIINKIKSKK